MKRACGPLVTGAFALFACNNPAVSTSAAPAQPVNNTPAAAGTAAPAASTTPATASATVEAAQAPAVQAASPVIAAPAAPAQPAAAGSAAPATADPASAPVVSEPQPVASLTIKVPQVEPGAEDTQCVQIRLSNAAPLDIVSLHNQLSPGSHHFIVTALNDKAAPEQPLTRCQGFGGAVTGAPLTITQAHDDHVKLPDGLGYRLNAGHVIHLEMHYINTTDKTLDISATTNMYAAEPGAQLQPAAVMLMGTADFTIPAHGTLDTGPKFLQLPAGMEDTKFFQITGHTHAYGTNVNVRLADALQTPVADLYTPKNFDWEAPESKPLTPYVSVPAGGGFLIDCSWNNTSDADLKWGESAKQEMCFFWGYYFPRKDVFSIVVDNIDQDLLKMVASMPPADKMDMPATP